MAGEYQDGRIQCTSEGVEIHGYYFPWGTKHIPYGSIRSYQRVEMGTLRGKGRIWGTANPRYWANLDPRRPGKEVGLILDLGRFVHPFITPDDPDAFEAVIRKHTDLFPATDEEGRGPLI
ncbi:MAG: hypothetical protein ACRDWB_06055 [Acidimicrobiales bacterium]